MGFWHIYLAKYGAGVGGGVVTADFGQTLRGAIYRDGTTCGIISQDGTKLGTIHHDGTIRGAVK